MGWYFTQGSSLKSLMAELSAGSERILEDGTHVKVETLAKCFRGAVTHKGTLWSVIRTTKTFEGKVTFKDCIRCDLLERQHGFGWGHKPLDESMNPFYYNCPEKYLKMTPVVCQEWRDLVRDYHKKRRDKRAVANA